MLLGFSVIDRWLCFWLCHCDRVCVEVDGVDIDYNVAVLAGLVGVKPVSIEAGFLVLERR